MRSSSTGSKTQKDLLTVDLLVEVAKTTKPGSKPRHEFCQKAKALTKFADLPGIKKLEKVHTKYVAKIPKLPTTKNSLPLQKNIGMTVDLAGALPHWLFMAAESARSTHWFQLVMVERHQC